MEQVINLSPVKSANLSGAKQTYLLCDSEGFANAAEPLAYNSHSDASWVGRMGKEESIRCIRQGDLSGVSKSDQFMAKLEDQIFVGTGYKNIYDVVGAIPSVPAYIAGVPECMRRRHRVATESSPLAICVDLTSSGGIDANHVMTRGTAILALVRLLSSIRPIELYANVALGRQGFACEIVCKIETAPLDLARAAHILTHPSVSRGLGYAICQQRFRSGGHWPFDLIDTHRRTARESLMRILPCQDLLYMPPVFARDNAINNPVQWIKTMLKQYGGPSVVLEESR